MFAGGKGTPEKPYLIETREQMQNISAKYEDATPSYYKVADGVKEMDCSDWTSIELFGSFDGNGMVFNSLEGNLFYTVKDNITVELKNFTVISSAQYHFSSHNAPLVYWTDYSIEFTNVYVQGCAIGYSIASYVGQCYSPADPLTFTFNNCFLQFI